MSRSEGASNDNALSKLLEATNSLHVDDEFSSKFKAPAVEYPKFSPNDLITKMATIERDCAVCAKDVHFLIKFYLHSTSNSRVSVTSEGYEEYQKLLKKYRVERKVKGDNITLHRIAAAFPIVSVNLLRQFQIDRKFSTEMLKAKDAGDFPWCMRTQMCLSLVPMIPPYVNNLEHHNLIFGVIAYMYYENKIVNDNKKNVAPSAVFEKILNIAHTVYKDSNVDEEKKKHAWNHVIFDYTANRESVNGLLRHFRSEVPDAETAFKHRFEFHDPKPNNCPKRAIGKGPANYNTKKRPAK